MKKVFALLCMVFVFTACKRDAPLPVPTNSITQNIYLTNDTDFCANFTVYQSQSKFYANPVLHTSYQISASFGPANSATFAVDSLFFDNVFFPYDSVNKTYDTYMAGGAPIIINTNTWRVVGANGIPSFTFNQNLMPTFNYTVVPDTIDRTQGLTLPINITSSNDGRANIGNVYKYFNPQTTNSVYFSPAELGNATASGYGYLYVNAYNNNSYKVFGKTMVFEYLYNFNKQIYFK